MYIKLSKTGYINGIFFRVVENKNIISMRIFNCFGHSYKSFAKCEVFDEGSGSYYDFDNCLFWGESSRNVSHSHHIRSYFWQGIWPGVMVCSGISLVSSSRELVCDEWFAIQSLLPCCLIAFFIVLLGALPEITIKSKPLRAFYWGQIWTDFWWDLSSFRITVVFWVFSKRV